MSVTIVSNGHTRPTLSWYDLTPREREGFDWTTQDEKEGATFFRYRGNAYAFPDFSAVGPSWIGPREFFEAGWNGYQPDSFFSGVLVRRVDDDRIVVGRYYS